MRSSISSVKHYENFPVASRLVPARLRPAIAAVYWFARSADDIADEGTASAEERLTQLAAYERALAKIGRNPPFAWENCGLNSEQCSGFAHIDTIARTYPQIVAPLQSLLSAFRQDSNFRPLASTEDLLDYCSRSADPVGRIVLILFDQDAPALWPAADAICTSLQLINFLQDVSEDAKRSRVYVPLDALEHANFSAQEWLDTLSAAPRQMPEPAWLARAQQLIRSEHARAQALLTSGHELIALLNKVRKLDSRQKELGRLSLELRATIAGGQCILDKIARAQFNPFAPRPRLGALDWIKIALTLFLFRA